MVYSNPVYTIQPVVKPVVKHRLSNRFDNRFDNKLYRVNGASESQLIPLEHHSSIVVLHVQHILL